MENQTQTSIDPTNAIESGQNLRALEIMDNLTLPTWRLVLLTT